VAERVYSNWQARVAECVNILTKIPPAASDRFISIVVCFPLMALRIIAMLIISALPPRSRCEFCARKSVPDFVFVCEAATCKINLRALEARRAHALKLPMNIYPSVDSFRESKSTDATAASVATFSSYAYALRGCAAAFDCRALSFRSSTCFLSDVCYFGTMRPALEFRHGVKFCT
jgi:hypothetical protein